VIYAILLFAATYVLMLIFSKYRPYVALAAGLNIDPTVPYFGLLSGATLGGMPPSALLPTSPESESSARRAIP